MKCGNCKKRMRMVLGETVISLNDIDVCVKNIPIFECENCGNRIIHDVIIGRAENYISQYGAQDNRIDFGKCERKESEEATVIMQLSPSKNPDAKPSKETKEMV